jgi:hypothetical protein
MLGVRARPAAAAPAGADSPGRAAQAAWVLSSLREALPSPHSALRPLASPHAAASPAGAYARGGAPLRLLHEDADDETEASYSDSDSDSSDAGAPLGLVVRLAPPPPPRPRTPRAPTAPPARGFFLSADVDSEDEDYATDGDESVAAAHALARYGREGAADAAAAAAAAADTAAAIALAQAVERQREERRQLRIRVRRVRCERESRACSNQSRALGLRAFVHSRAHTLFRCAGERGGAGARAGRGDGGGGGGGGGGGCVCARASRRSSGGARCR